MHWLEFNGCCTPTPSCIVTNFTKSWLYSLLSLSLFRKPNGIPGPLFTADETPLYIGFLAAEGSGQDGCLSRAACHSPQTANEYLRAAKAVVKGAEMFDDYWNTTSYDKLIYQVEQSIKEGRDGAPCDSIYQCHIWNSSASKHQHRHRRHQQELLLANYLKLNGNRFYFMR